MISINEAILIQDILIDKFGGSRGIRDKGLLESAINRPFQTFDSKELYPTVTKKATALIESILTNHPFIDGNKRIGYVLMRLFLNNNGYDINASHESKYDFIVQIASGKYDFNQISNWIDNHLIERTIE